MSKNIRYSFELIAKKYAKRGKGSVRLTQSSLLLAQAIDSKKSDYTFPVLTTDNAVPPLPWEIRLNINDEFVSYDLAYYLVAEKTVARTGGDPTPVEIPSQFAGHFFFSYAPDELDASFALVEDGWLGVLNISVNNINRLTNWDLKKHNFIPRTQFQNSSVGIPSATQPNLDYSDDGTFPMQPMLTLSGAKKNLITTSLVSAIPSTTTGLWTLPDTGTVRFDMLYFSLIFRGMLAQNAAKFQ
jgi:hypothetical protein